jgi:hypothetical protein
MTDKEHDCAWCGDADPMQEVLGSDVRFWPVIPVAGTDGKFGQVEYFHAPCHGTLMQHNVLRDAIKATGWSRATFMMNVDLLASEIEEDGPDETYLMQALEQHKFDVEDNDNDA